MKPTTRTNTKTHSSKPTCNTTEPQSAHPSSSPNPKTTNPDHNRSPPEVESKKRWLNKGKNKAHIEEDDVEEIQEIIARDGAKRTLFRQYMPNATVTGLDRLKLTKDERVLIHRVFGYGIHAGRSYSKKWYAKFDGLNFFDAFLNFQGWVKISEFSGPVYPIEVIQFYATVPIKHGCLCAIVSGTEVKVSIDDFCALFSVPDDRAEINSSAEWGTLTEDERTVVKNYFEVDSKGGSRLLAGNLSPKLKFFLNFLWNTIVPRRGGRDKLSTYEMVVVYNWMEGKKVSLPLLVFHRIIQTAMQVTEDKVYTTIDLPYGMWVSRILESKGVVSPESYGVSAKDEMSDTHLKLMKISACGPDLVFQVKGNSGDKSEVLEAIEKKLDAFMVSVNEKLEAQTKLIESLVSGMAKGKGVGLSSESISNDELVARLKAFESKVALTHKATDRTIHEAIRQTTTLANLATQGGALLRAGCEMREEMGLVYEATRALALKVTNFDTYLVAQANNVSSCLDRLDSLEYRTRPGYVDPTQVHHP